MADSFAMERFKARLLPKAPPAPVYRAVPMSALERIQLLMRATTMDEIRAAAKRLGLTFSEAYQERRSLYARVPVSDWPEMLQPERTFDRY